MKRLCLAIALLLPAAAMAEAAPEARPGRLATLAKIVAEMAPNSWRELPDVHCRGLWPSDAELRRLLVTGRPQAVWTAWTTGAFDGEHLYFGPGGGHNAYGGAESYKISLETLECSYVTPPRRLVPPQAEWPKGATFESYHGNPERARSPSAACALEWMTDDGTFKDDAYPAFPTGGHITGGLVHVRKGDVNALFWHHGRHQQCAGLAEYRSTAYWMLDLNKPDGERRWEAFHNVFAGQNWRLGVLPDGNLLVFAAWRIYVVDPSEVVTSRLDPNDPRSPMVRHHRIVKRSRSIGHAQYSESNISVYPHEDGRFWGLNYSGTHFITVNPDAPDRSGGLLPQSIKRPALGWGHTYTTSILPVGDKIFLWNGGRDIDAFDPKTRAHVRWSHDDGPVQADGRTKPFNKLVHVRVGGVDVLVTHANPFRGLYIYRLAEDLTEGDKHWPPRGG